jgi:hypothetical protein
VPVPVMIAMPMTVTVVTVTVVTVTVVTVTVVTVTMAVVTMVMAMVGRGGARRSNTDRQCGGDCQC